MRVTLPRWGVTREAQALVDANRAWIARQRLRLDARVPSAPWRDGSSVLVDGQPHRVRAESSDQGLTLWCGDARAAMGLPVGADIEAAVLSWLRDRARRELPAELQALAARHGIVVPRVSVRDQRSRWGACSPGGTITLNWRLVQVPPFVRDYVLHHELMHRRELNHSHRFWRLVTACCPRHADARRWLRQEGKTLWTDCE